MLSRFWKILTLEPLRRPQQQTTMGVRCSKVPMDNDDDYDSQLYRNSQVTTNGDGLDENNNYNNNDDDDDNDEDGAYVTVDKPREVPMSPVAAGNKRSRETKRSSLRRSIFRVGSRTDRRTPNEGGGGGGILTDDDVPGSPRARASTYSHVHDAVMYNLSEAEVSRHDKSVPMGVIGLRNLGNTCFINSSLQCLSATIPLADYFLGYDYRSEINKKNFLGTGGKLATAYAELMKQMWLGKKSVVDPSDFKRQLGTFAPQFSGYHQHDSQELLAFLLDGIHEDLNRVKERPYIEDKDCDGTRDEQDAIEAWKNYLRRNKSLVVDLFQGQLKNTCKCLTCGHQNIRFEPFMYLSLPITDKCRSVDDCMDLYLEQETLKGGDQWYCEKCKKHVDATKKTDLWILPPILIVHLKRFRYNDYGKVGSKNDAPIKYPVSQWDLKSRVRSQAGVYPMYDLYAVSNHMGSLGGGHYTALALNRFDDLWYEFNDSSYRSVDDSIHKRQTKAAYVLFYNRSEGDLSMPLNERSPMIRRQSVSRPDLWPHTQVDDRDKVRDFTRSSRRIMDMPQFDKPRDRMHSTDSIPENGVDSSRRPQDPPVAPNNSTRSTSSSRDPPGHSGRTMKNGKNTHLLLKRPGSGTDDNNKRRTNSLRSDDGRSGTDDNNNNNNNHKKRTTSLRSDDGRTRDDKIDKPPRRHGSDERTNAKIVNGRLVQNGGPLEI